MTPERFEAITARYPALRVAVLGDFCLDRYLDIDPARQETSIETGLPVHNVVQVRPQPGGAGTIVNNLAALGIGSIYPIGFAGRDGEGSELGEALEKLPGVRLTYFLHTRERRTFTYCKPLVLAPAGPPVELHRLDFKNWTPTPDAVQEQIIHKLEQAAEQVDALIVLDQVSLADTGVVTRKILEAVHRLLTRKPKWPVLADSRRGLRDFPPVIFKMNAAELSALRGLPGELSPAEVAESAAALARQNGRSVFVTMAERGILGASPEGRLEQVPALPLRGPIDIVGAGDSVSANLACALAAGADLRETIELANAGASVVIHKLGTTGTASLPEIRHLLS